MWLNFMNASPFRDQLVFSIIKRIVAKGTLLLLLHNCCAFFWSTTPFHSLLCVCVHMRNFKVPWEECYARALRNALEV